MSTWSACIPGSTRVTCQKVFPTRPAPVRNTSAIGELAFATRGAGQGEIGDVGACRQQQHADRAEENQQRSTRGAVAAFVQRYDHRRRFVAALLLEPAHDGRQFRLRRFDRGVGAQPRHHGIADPLGVRVAGGLRHVQRNPEAFLAANSKRRRKYADDEPGPSVDCVVRDQSA
jgi:hypothetical protein